MSAADPWEQKKALGNALLQMKYDGYLNAKIIPPLRRFWESKFLPTFKEKYKRLTHTQVDVNVTQFDERNVQITSPKQVESGEERGQKWQVWLKEWKVEFAGRVSPPPSRMRLTLGYEVSMEVLTYLHDDDKLEIKEITPQKISIHYPTIELGGDSMLPILLNTTIAQFNPTYKEFDIQDTGVEKLVEIVAVSAHIKTGGVKHWLWEIAAEIIDRLEKELVGRRIRPTYNHGNIIIIDEMKISPPSGGSVIFLSGEWGEREKTRVDKIELAHPLKVTLNTGEKFSGRINIAAEFTTPVTTPPPPTIKLGFIIIEIMRENGKNLLDITAYADKKIACEGRKLPPAKGFVGDDVIETIIEKIEFA